MPNSCAMRRRSCWPGRAIAGSAFRHASQTVGVRPEVSEIVYAHDSESPSDIRRRESRWSTRCVRAPSVGLVAACTRRHNALRARDVDIDRVLVPHTVRNRIFLRCIMVRPRYGLDVVPHRSRIRHRGRPLLGVPRTRIGSRHANHLSTRWSRSRSHARRDLADVVPLRWCSPCLVGDRVGIFPACRTQSPWRTTLRHSRRVDPRCTRRNVDSCHVASQRSHRSVARRRTARPHPHGSPCARPG